MHHVRNVVGIALAGTILLAAPAAAVTLHPGIKAGVNIANFRGDFADLAGTNARVALNAGVTGAVDFGGPVSVETGLYYAQRGAKTITEETDVSGNVLGTFDTFYELDYLEIPVLARVNPMPHRFLMPYVIGGPAIAFKIRSHVKSGIRGISGDLPNVSAVDFGLTAGVGVAVPRGAWTYGIEGRYTSGMSDVFDAAGSLENKHSVFTILVSAAH